MTKEEKCRLIAEWLGWRLEVLREAEPRVVVWHEPTCKCGIGGVRRACVWSNPPDPYLSEEASAMVLEKLAKAAGTVELIRFDKWGVNPPRWSCGAPRTQSGEKDVRGPDRKTCIADAAIAYIQAKERGK